MKSKYFSRIATLVATASVVAETHAQTSQLVYSQDFNDAAVGTTGTGLNDGSNIVHNASGFTARVYDSTEWGALPAGQEWKALFMTPMSAGVLSNYFLPVTNPGQSLSSFSADFSLLINYINRNSESIADGFSINFGKFNNTSDQYGAEAGMHSPGDGKTGDVLTVSWFTYSGSNPRIEARYNGNTIATGVQPPFYNIQNPPPNSAFLPVNFSWDSNGLDLTYNNIPIFTDLAVEGFSPGIGYSFAMAARTGAAYENLFVDDIAINTTAAPFVWSGGSGDWTSHGDWTIGTAPTTNNNWIIMEGSGGNANNNAVGAMEGLVFGSGASGAYVLSGNGVTIGADGIVNRSSSNQTVNSNITLGAAQTFEAANGALTFGGTIDTGSNALGIEGSHSVTISGSIGGTGAVTNNAALVFDSPAATALSNDIGGSGTLTQQGSGTLTLTGANSYSGTTTISAGGLQVGDGGTAGTLGSGAVTNHATLTFDRSDATTVPNLISGTGSLTKQGSGTLTLTGENTYSGLTRVNGGTLALGSSASIAGSEGVSITSGASFDVSAHSGGFTLGSSQNLSGGGTVVGDLVIAGSHTPGFSPGLQSVNGSLSYDAGSSITWELAANTASGRGTSWDAINVTGDLDFSGATSLVLDFDPVASGDFTGSEVDFTHNFWVAGLGTGGNGWKIFDVVGTISGLDNLSISGLDWLDASGNSFLEENPRLNFELYEYDNGVYLTTTMSPIPEPGSLLGLAGVLGGGLMLRRRKGA